MLRSVVITFIFLATLFEGFSQTRTVQVMGSVFSEDSVSTLPFAHIISNQWATTTNSDGRFTAPLDIKDSIRVSYVGYKDTIVKIPTGYDDDPFVVDIFMARDTIYLKEAEIFFLPENEEEFKEAILALQLDDQEYDYAVRNIELLKRQLKYANYDDDEADSKENHKNYIAGPQPARFNIAFDKVRKAIRKKRNLPDLADINPTYDRQDSATSTPQVENRPVEPPTVEDTLIQYILKQPVKENK